MKKLLFSFLPLILSTVLIQAQNLPFPQQNRFEGSIIPNHISHAELSLAVSNMYDSWKTDFLKETIMADGYYVLGDCTGCSVESKGTSEGHGYGMLITVLMAGYDPDAKLYFDGLWLFFDSYRSQTNNELMNWNVAADERDPWTGSATDGDMDIAYALLLAHYQWGSDGSINYIDEAIDMINKGLKIGDMNTSSKRVMLGDWDSDPLSTRPSDWMAGHFRAYAKATEDDFWLEACDSIYSMVQHIQANQSASTGLMPDFVVGKPAQPSQPNFLEGPNDGSYYYNACRFPWRVASDFLHYGTIESKNSLSPFINWANETINNDFDNYTAGYTLDGKPLNEYTDMVFTAPLVLAFCTDTNYQEILNKGWNYIAGKYHAYFDASVSLLSQLMITGNWWAPTDNTRLNIAPQLELDYPSNGQKIALNEAFLFKLGGLDTVNIASLTIYKGTKRITQIKEAPFEFEHVLTELGEQIFKVIAETVDGKSSIWQVVVSGSNSTSVKTDKYALEFYPNPVKETLNIESSDLAAFESYAIYNELGVLLQSNPINQNNSQIMMNDFPSGIYFIKIVGEKVNYCSKIIKN